MPLHFKVHTKNPLSNPPNAKWNVPHSTPPIPNPTFRAPHPTQHTTVCTTKRIRSTGADRFQGSTDQNGRSAARGQRGRALERLPTHLTSSSSGQNTLNNTVPPPPPPPPQTQWLQCSSGPVTASRPAQLWHDSGAFAALNTATVPLPHVLNELQASKQVFLSTSKLRCFPFPWAR